MPQLYRQDELDNMMYEEARKEHEREYAEYERTYAYFDQSEKKDPKKLLVSLMMLGQFAENLRDTGDIYGRDPLKCD